jgi:hypothetical protein
MPVSFTLLSPPALLILIGGIFVVNLLRKLFGHKHHS